MDIAREGGRVWPGRKRRQSALAGRGIIVPFVQVCQSLCRWRNTSLPTDAGSGKQNRPTTVWLTSRSQIEQERDNESPSEDSCTLSDIDVVRSNVPKTAGGIVGPTAMLVAAVLASIEGVKPGRPAPKQVPVAPLIAMPISLRLTQIG